MAQKGVLHDLAGILQRDIIFFYTYWDKYDPTSNHGKTMVKPW